MNLRHYFAATALLFGLTLAVFLPMRSTPAFASRNSAGSYSLPSGNPVVSGTTITSAWANGTLSDLSTEVTNSLDRNGRGGMNAPLQLYSGSASIPGLDFLAEPATGIYRAASGDIRLQINAQQVMRWTDAGTTSNSITATANAGAPQALAGIAIGATQTSLTHQDGGVGVVGYGGNVGLTPSGVVGFGGSGPTAAGYGVEGTSGYGQNGAYASGGYFNGGTNPVSGGSGAFGLNVFGGTGAGAGSGGYGIQVVGGAGGASGTPAAGIYSVGGANNGIGAEGAVVTAGVAATGTARTDALNVVSGDIRMSSVANPNSNVAFANRLTPKNLVKAWGKVCGAGGTAVTVSDGFNVSTADTSGGASVILVSLAQPMSSSAYAVVATLDDTALASAGTVTALSSYNYSASQFGLRRLVAGTATAWSSGQCAHFMVLGAQ